MRNGLKTLLIAATLLCGGLASQLASASLVTFEFFGSAACTGTGAPFACDPATFTADTGLTAFDPHPFTGLVTIETSVAPVLPGSYEMNGLPGTGLSVTIGTRTLSFDHFTVDLRRDLFCGGDSDVIGLGAGGPFNMAFTTCGGGPEHALTSRTLDGLAESVLDPFTGGGGSRHFGNGFWTVDASAVFGPSGIRRVPEPAIAALMLVAVLVVVMTRSRRRGPAARQLPQLC